MRLSLEVKLGPKLAHLKLLLLQPLLHWLLQFSLATEVANLVILKVVLLLPLLRKLQQDYKKEKYGTSVKAKCTVTVNVTLVTANGITCAEGQIVAAVAICDAVVALGQNARTAANMLLARHCMHGPCTRCSSRW